MAWYGRDYGERGWGGTHRQSGSGWGGQPRRESGWGGSQQSRESGWGEGYQPRESGWSGRSQRRYGWDYQEEGLGNRYRGRSPHERDWGHSEEYDRDMGDQLREGWQDLKRGVRRAFTGNEYDQPYRSSGYGRSRYDEGFTDRGWSGRPSWGAENRGYRRDWNRDRFW